MKLRVQILKTVSPLAEVRLRTSTLPDPLSKSLVQCNESPSKRRWEEVRTVYFDNLSPQVTESVLRSALEQFAIVKSLKFIPNYIGPSNLPQCALLELDSAKKANEVILMIKQYPFMMSGMPRPIRARPADDKMFDDRPIVPDRKIHCSWLDPSDPDFAAGEELKRLTCKHAVEVRLRPSGQLIL